MQEVLLSLGLSTCRCQCVPHPHPGVAELLAGGPQNTSQTEALERGLRLHLGGGPLRPSSGEFNYLHNWYLEEGRSHRADPLHILRACCILQGYAAVEPHWYPL